MTNFNNLSQLHSTDLSRQTTASQRPTASQRLERLWSLPPTNRQQSSLSLQQRGSDWLKQAGQWLVAFLTDEQSVRIWTSYSKDGVVWHAYDPMSDRRSFHTSEADLRAWLETRHLSQNS